MPWSIRIAAALVQAGLLAATSLSFPGPTRAAEPEAHPPSLQCGSGTVVIRSPLALDARLACQGADDAIAFLRAQGLDVSHAVAVDLVHRMPEAADASSAGHYLESEGRALVMGFREFASFGTWFGLPIDQALYRSLVAHEVAHALAARNFCVDRPSIQAKEYIAYVTMLATMPTDLRERILANYPNHGYDDEVQMSSTIYMFDPMRFGVQAYRHFLRPGNGRDFLRAILRGDALVE